MIMVYHQNVQSHGSYLRSMSVTILLRNTRGHHVAVIHSVHLHQGDYISYFLHLTVHLEDIILAQAAIKHLVERVKKCDHLKHDSLYHSSYYYCDSDLRRSALLHHLYEVKNITEVYCH